MANEANKASTSLVSTETDAVEVMEPDEALASDGPLENISPFIQWPVALVGLVGFLYSIFTVPGAAILHPIFGPIALGWFVFAFLVAIINRIDHIGLPGAKFSFRKKLERTERAVAKTEFAVDALESALSDVTNVFQNWMSTVNLFREQLEKYAKSREDINDIFVRFCLERMEEAKDVIGVEGERFRFSLWLYAEDIGGLKMAVSDAIRDEATRNHVFRPGAGLCGQCFVEDRVFNYDDAPSSISFEKIHDKPEYRGLLLVPVKITTDGGVVGVLSIDRAKKEYFSRNAEDMGQALSHLLAYAISTTWDFAVSADSTSVAEESADSSDPTGLPP